MKKIYLFNLIFLLPFSTYLFAQAVCNGILPFIEKDGLVTIEMETGILVGDWKIGTSQSGYTGDGYIFWDGQESFNALTGSQITYNVNINTTGTYQFIWRTVIGKLADVRPNTEHNDAWVKIEADDFYGEKDGGSIVRPRPQCETDPSADCPEGRSVGGFFKVYGNNLNYQWVGFTSDNDPHKVYARFDNPGTYKITIDARSSYLFIDRMVLRRTNISDAIALNTNNPQSDCDSTLSVNQSTSDNTKLSLHPVPASDKLYISHLPASTKTISIHNVTGATIRKINVNSTELEIDISDFPSGLYILSYSNGSKTVAFKFLKK